MERMNDDVKKQIIDKLLEEPPMVLSTAYVYAKNYVEYGEDITKAWTTAVQQESIIEEVRQKAWTVAYEDFKANCEDIKKEYETRLKADMVAILDKVRNEIDKIHEREGSSFDCLNALDELKEFIDKLKAERGIEDGKHF